MHSAKWSLPCASLNVKVNFIYITKRATQESIDVRALKYRISHWVYPAAVYIQEHTHTHTHTHKKLKQLHLEKGIPEFWLSIYINDMIVL